MTSTSVSSSSSSSVSTRTRTRARVMRARTVTRGEANATARVRRAWVITTGVTTIGTTTRTTFGSISRSSSSSSSSSRSSSRRDRAMAKVRAASEVSASEPARLTARALTLRVMEYTVRDAPLSVMLTLVAGAWAQTVNLGGTFALALAHAHTIPLVAAAFTLVVALWKFMCSMFVRVAVMRGSAQGDDEGCDWRDLKTNAARRATVKIATRELRGTFATCKALLTLDFRRVVSILWNSVLTIPVPYLGLIRLLDYAVAGPVLVLEQKTSGEALKRSQELMYGYRVLLMKTAFLCSTVASIMVGGVIGAFAVVVPTLPQLLLPPEVASSTTATTVGDVAQGFFSGSAFDRVWQVGSSSERSATIVLLMCGLTLSFFFTLGFRQLVYIFYKETKERYVPPPPEDPAKKNKTPLLRRLQFWRRSTEEEST
jgi:hypothetical protein